MARTSPLEKKEARNREAIKECNIKTMDTSITSGRC